MVLPLSRLRPARPPTRASRSSAREGRIRVRAPLFQRVFSDHIYSVLALRPRERRFRRDSVVGNEGIVGIALFMGGESMPNRAVVQSAGKAYRLDGQTLKQEFSRSGAFQHLLMRYTLALFSQMAQTAVCNRHHSVDQQLCRWLLLSHDRLSGDELNMTQELIADMLGVRREGVTEAAGKLQQAGLIHYSRGHITIVDRPGLEARVCECYEVVRKEFKRLLPDVTAD